ncbi:MAG: Signal peptidase peptidase, partial [Verrucomicrobiota bacterium]
VFNPRVRAADVQRGDSIAFHQEGFRIQPPGDNPWVFREGPILGRVFGLPGDRIVFTPKSVRVNGRDEPRLEGMPIEGEQLVEAGQWFVWPTVRLPGQGVLVGGFRRNPDAPFAEAFHRMSAVRHSDFLGRVYGRWFFHDQTQP